MSLAASIAAPAALASRASASRRGCSRLASRGVTRTRVVGAHGRIDRVARAVASPSLPSGPLDALPVPDFLRGPLGDIVRNVETALPEHQAVGDSDQIHLGKHDAGAHAAGSTSSLSSVHALAALPDGKYVVGGSFTAFDENTAPYLARLNSNGSFDGTFSPPAIDSNVEALLAQPGGKLVIGGRFSTPSNGVARLLPGGSTDATFDVGTGTFNGSTA